MPKVGRAGKAQIRDHKIKQLGAMHPNSRKAAQKHLELLHDDKKAMHIMTRDLKWKPQLIKYQWFQRCLWMDEQKSYTKEEVMTLAVEYITRNDEELYDVIKASLIGGGKGKIAPTSKAFEKLNYRDMEVKQFEAGEFIMPDLVHTKVVRALNDWKTGNVDQMQLIKTAKYGEPDLVPELVV